MVAGTTHKMQKQKMKQNIKSAFYLSGKTNKTLLHKLFIG